MNVYAIQTLSTVTRIGVLGDLHGDLFHVLEVSRMLAGRGVRVLLQLGDFGVIWPGHNWASDVAKLSRRLAEHRQSFFFVDGNHEFFPNLHKFPIRADGLRWIASNIAHLPRGFRTLIGGQHVLAALGGANSIDRSHRSPGHSWWPEEAITEADLTEIGSERADVLVGHEVPQHVPGLEQLLTDEDQWAPQDVRYAKQGRAMFHRALLQTRPRLSLGGHYHCFIDETITSYTATGVFPTRVVVLDMNGPATISTAILDTRTLELEFMDRRGNPPGGSCHLPQVSGDGL